MISDLNFDPGQWLARLCVIAICASLGIILAIIDKQKTRLLAIIQVLLSTVTPISVGLYIYHRKNSGAVVCSDMDQIIDELGMIKYGDIVPIVFIVLYIFLAISTVLTIQKNITLNKANNQKE